ncbi:MAG: NUDIX domain-containing protein [Candidatus Berkelbacteria bacterium]|nr:NUDIX domain-containing protein [Candidatus Berkelbacteria bacterium]
MKYKQIKDREMHRIVATAIIHKNGKYLITKRSMDKKVYPGKWTVPGGGLAIDDYVNEKPNDDGCWYFSLEKSLRREIKEEVNLEVGKIDFLLDLCFIRPDNTPVITLSFYAPYKKGKVVLSDEDVDFAWTTLAEIKNYDLISGIKEEIYTADDIINGREFKNYFI